MSISPWKPGGMPFEELQARRRGTDTGVPVHERMQRVKVFCLTDEGKWDDQGTGHVTIDCIEGSRELALVVVDEEDNETLLLHNITSDDIYRKQEESIISWKDPEQSLELALSFQEASGCSFIWHRMQYIQQNLQFNILRSQIGELTAFECLEASRGSLPHDESLISVHGELKDLPPLELSSLPLILKIILEHGTTDKMRVAELISQDVIFLNNSAIYERIFSDALILDIIGALEYDPEVHNVQSHRTFLQEHVVFKEAIPIRNASVVSKIHQTYRIGYIKDIIFPRAQDDATLESLNTIIQANNAIVSRLLKDDASFIHELITRMKSSNISAESKSKLVLFLHELCTLSKCLRPVQQLQLSRDLIGEGLFDIISDLLQSCDKVVASTGTSILMHFLDQDPSLVIKYIAHQDQSHQEGKSLLEILIQGMGTDSGGAMHFQCYQILRTLMDSSHVKMTADHKEIAIEVSYEKLIHILIDVIASSCRPKGIAQSTSGSVGVATMVEEYPAKPEILLNICELLCFCVLHNPYRIKLNFVTSNALEKILTLTRRREKALVVAAVKFMRTVIGRKDEFLIDHIIKFNLLKPIIEVFVDNSDRYNMLHSGVLELLEYIRKENIEFLIEYVYKSFWDHLVKFERLESIRAFKLKYRQIVNGVKTKPSNGLIDMRKKTKERVLIRKRKIILIRIVKKILLMGQCMNRRNLCLSQLIVLEPAKMCKLVGHANSDDDKKNFNQPPKRPLSSDEDDQALHIHMMGRISLDGKHTDVKANKKPKLEVTTSCATIVSASAVNIEDRHSDFEDLGNESPGSQTELSAQQNLDSARQTGDDCTEAAQNSFPKID